MLLPLKRAVHFKVPVGEYLTVCYDEDGVEQWTKRYNSTNNGEDIPSAISVKDGCDTVYITGTSNNNYCTVVYYPIKLDAKNENNKNITDKLNQNYPNPFNPTTTIIASLIPSKGGEQDVRIAIYDIQGKEIASFIPAFRGVQEGLERYEVSWNASNLTSGIYFYTLHVNGNLIDKKKMILVK